MKSNTQNKKIEAITEKTLVIGIDVGSETHYARAFDYRGIEFSKKPFKFSNSEAGFEMFKAWILDIKEKHEKDKVVPGMEPTGHYWFNLGKFLQDNEMKPVLVNPHHVKKSKELDDNNPTKNDRKDPKVIAGLVKEGRYIGKARLAQLHGIFHMDEQMPFRFEWDWLAPSGLSTKDFIAPSGFEFRTGKQFRMGKKYGAVSFLQILAPELNDRMLADFLDMESSLIVSLHIQSRSEEHTSELQSR